MKNRIHLLSRAARNCQKPTLKHGYFLLLIALSLTINCQVTYAQESNCNCPLVVGSEVGITKLSTSGITLPKVGGCIKVRGEFSIDVSFPVGNQFDGVDVQMDPGALLIIANNPRQPVTRASIVNSTFRGCSNMWRGIYLRSKPVSNSVSKLDMHNCVVRDAQYAIEPSSGSLISLSQNNFDKNWTGLYLKSFNGNQGFSLSGNTFQGTGALLPPFGQQAPLPGSQATYGIYMDKCADVSIGEPSVNFFKGLKAGIYAQFCFNTIIKRCEFDGVFPPWLFFDGSKGIELYSCTDNQISNNKFW